MTAPTLSEAVPFGIDWAVAERPLPGQMESGDSHAVNVVAEGLAVAVIDGLGHGHEAAVAANAAAQTLTQHADKPVDNALKLCHEALRRTRGAVISAAVFDTRLATLSWTGVGNVEGLLFRAAPEASPPREALLLRGGVVGYSLPSLRVSKLDIYPGDTLVFATDGISGAFKTEAMCSEPVQDVADALLNRYGKATDDALVLVARYSGAP